MEGTVPGCVGLGKMDGLENIQMAGEGPQNLVAMWAGLLACSPLLPTGDQRPENGGGQQPTFLGGSG